MMPSVGCLLHSLQADYLDQGSVFQQKNNKKRVVLVPNVLYCSIYNIQVQHAQHAATAVASPLACWGGVKKQGAQSHKTAYRGVRRNFLVQGSSSQEAPYIGSARWPKITNARVHWVRTSRVGLHRSMVKDSPFYGEQNTDRHGDQRQSHQL